MVKPILVFTWRVNAKGFYPSIYSMALRHSFASVIITLGFPMFKLVVKFRKFRLLQWYDYYQWLHIFVAFRFLAKPLVQMSTNKNCISNLNEYSFRNFTLQVFYRHFPINFFLIEHSCNFFLSVWFFIGSLHPFSECVVFHRFFTSFF